MQNRMRATASRWLVRSQSSLGVQLLAASESEGPRYGYMGYLLYQTQRGETEASLRWGCRPVHGGNKRWAWWPGSGSRIRRQLDIAQQTARLQSRRKFGAIHSLETLWEL
jgi:hypothetical protein